LRNLGAEHGIKAVRSLKAVLGLKVLPLNKTKRPSRLNGYGPPRDEDRSFSPGLEILED
jgi:hypothetical protein